MGQALLFWVISIMSLIGAFGVLLIPNPVFSALSLAVTMVSIAGLFAMLGAPFVAGVQLIVYAGAVMVLFVMVLMLFDLKQEKHAFSKGNFFGLIKLISLGMFGGFVMGVILVEGNYNFLKTSIIPAEDHAGGSLAQLLFTKHLFSFEALGVLLLIIAIGAVALARSKGGTHAK